MIDAFIAHLQANTASFATITHAKDQQPIDDIAAELPLIGVFPGDDQTSEDGAEYLVSKMLNSIIQVHLVCPIENWESLKTELRTAAIGWSAGGEYTDLALVGGNILQLKGGVIWWQERYANQVIIREAY